MSSVVTKGIEKATNRPIALKKLLTHNPRDGVRRKSCYAIDRR